MDAVKAETYLSLHAFPGLHILERIRDTHSNILRLRIYKNGQRPAQEQPLEVPTESWTTVDDVLHQLTPVLKIPEREQLQPTPAFFDSQGRRINSIKAFKKQTVVFLLEIGQWMWPAVRVGFKQQAENVNGLSPATLVTISLRPVIFEIQNFISEEETANIQRIGAAQGLSASQGNLITADVNAGTAHAKFRTSKQTWLENEFPVAALLDERVANLTRIHRSHNEDVQLLRYDSNGYYHAHTDWGELELHHNQKDYWARKQMGYQDRLATVFWYLNDVAEGGETIFPKHGQPICYPDSRGSKDTRYCAGSHEPVLSSCEEGLKVKPKQGTVIFWYNLHPNGRGDRNALHAGCPVGPNQTKWSANKWVNVKPLTGVNHFIPGHPALERYGFQGWHRTSTKNEGVGIRKEL